MKRLLFSTITWVKATGESFNTLRVRKLLIEVSYLWRLLISFKPKLKPIKARTFLIMPWHLTRLGGQTYNTYYAGYHIVNCRDLSFNYKGNK